MLQFHIAWLSGVLEARLGCMRPCLKKTNKQKDTLVPRIKGFPTAIKSAPQPLSMWHTQHPLALALALAHGRGLLNIC